MFVCSGVRALAVKKKWASGFLDPTYHECTKTWNAHFAENAQNDRIFQEIVLETVRNLFLIKSFDIRSVEISNFFRRIWAFSAKWAFRFRFVRSWDFGILIPPEADGRRLFFPLQAPLRQLWNIGFWRKPKTDRVISKDALTIATKSAEINGFLYRYAKQKRIWPIQTRPGHFQRCFDYRDKISGN